MPKSSVGRYFRWYSNHTHLLMFINLVSSRDDQERSYTRLKLFLSFVYILIFQPQKLPIRAPKSKKDPKIKWKSKVRIEETTENKSCSTTWIDPKTVFEHYPDPKNSPLVPQNVKNYTKIKSKSKVRIDRTIKIKVVQLEPEIGFGP